MVPPTPARPVGDRPPAVYSAAASALFALSLSLLVLSLAVSSVAAAPGPGGSPASSPQAGDAPTDPVDDAGNETREVVDGATNATDEQPDESNESEGVGPVTPSNWSDGNDSRNDSADQGGESERPPWTWEWSNDWSDEDPMAEGDSGWPDEWLGPRADGGTERASTSDTTDEGGDGPGGSADDARAGSGPSGALAEALPSGGEDGCGGCSVVGGVGVVVAVGVSRRVGTALSFGASLPQPAVAPSFRTAVHWLDRRLPRLPPIVPGQYSRRDDSDPLAHVRRSELATVVAENPGVPLATLSDRLDVPRSTVRYHVRVLEEEDELETANVLGRRRLFPAGENAELVAALADEGTRRIVTVLARIQPATGSRIAEETGKANSTVSYHLDRLAAAGVVERDRDGKYVYNRLVADAEEVVATVDPPAPVEEVPR